MKLLRVINNIIRLMGFLRGATRMLKNDEIEIKRLEMEYDIAKTSTTSGVHARMIFLGFLITVNLAFFKEYYYLFKKAEWTWCFLLSLFALALNMFISLIYIREHVAQEENHRQVWEIRERYNELFGKEKAQHPNWFIIKGKEKGFFIGLTYKMISCILSLFLSLIIMSVLVTGLRMNKVEIDVPTIVFVLIFLFICVFSPITWGIYSAGKQGNFNNK